ncbi:MAG: phytanoyl-CoA dioxygenase family protein [Planctomycetota bacterium]|nr:phytanoyl-CoA dioxygenase family protein [Planctomycetota bacterium]
MPTPALTQDQIDSFHRDGYLSYGALLKPEELETLRAEYDAEFRKAAETGDSRNLADNKPDRADAKTRMLQIMQMCERNIHFRKLLYDTRILDIVQCLLGPNIMLFHDQALFKPAHTGGAVFWHQDNGYWKCAPANLVSCWMTLDDVVLENGAMQVIPGSHLKPVHHATSQATDALLEINGIDLAQAKAVELPAGGIMFHHCQTLHYTAPNTTPRQRRAFAIHYMTPGTTGRNGEAMKVDFKHPMLRACV